MGARALVSNRSQAGRQAQSQAGRQAQSQAGRQAQSRAGRHACPSPGDGPSTLPRRGRHGEGDGPGQGKLERVQKVLAHAGLGSRRSCEDLIKQGRVSIDGQIVCELGTRVDPSRAKIAVDGEAIRLESMVYYAINKPKGYVSTNLDPAGAASCRRSSPRRFPNGSTPSDGSTRRAPG